MQEGAFRPWAAVRDQIGLEETGFDVIPAGERADRHLLLDEQPPPRGRHPVRCVPFPIGSQDAIGGRRTEREELLPHCVGQCQMTMAFKRRHQLRQEGHEALGADAIRRRPRDDQRVLHGGTIDTARADGSAVGHGNGMREEPDGVLAGIAGGGDELIEDDGLLLWPRRLIARRDPCEQFAFGQKTHRGTHPSSLRVVMDPRRVTLLVRQRPAQSVFSHEAIRRQF